MTRILRHLLSACLLLGFAAAAGASPATPKDGVQYQTLPTPQPTDSGKKIEVIEFFAYYCPHCYAFEPMLSAWVKQQGDNIMFRRVHVPRDASVAPQQQLFYTLESMGVLDKYHDKAFAAMHVERLRLNQDEQVFDWAAKAGLDRARFIDTYRSFGVQAKVRRANVMMDAYHISSWPTVVIDGRFLTSPGLANQGASEAGSEAEQQRAALQVMDYLVAKAKADKK